MSNEIEAQISRQEQTEEAQAMMPQAALYSIGQQSLTSWAEAVDSIKPLNYTGDMLPDIKSLGTILSKKRYLGGARTLALLEVLVRKKLEMMFVNNLLTLLTLDDLIADETTLESITLPEVLVIEYHDEIINSPFVACIMQYGDAKTSSEDQLDIGIFLCTRNQQIGRNRDKQPMWVAAGLSNGSEMRKECYIGSGNSKECYIGSGNRSY
jgi:hypothetical protein